MVKMRPMLAARFSDDKNIEPELRELTYPLLASPKVDGIRFMKEPGVGARSRSWKLLPNKKLQEFLAPEVFDYFDGEVIVGDDPTAAGIFNKTQSAIMTASDTQDFSLWIFDHWGFPGDRFGSRTDRAHDIVSNIRSRGQLNVNYLKQRMLNTPKEVLAYEEAAIEEGWEGIMLRSLAAPYKFGRSTLREQGLIKVKRFEDAEARIVGYEALERNTNPQVRDAFGLAKRSAHRAGKVPDELLGKLLVRAEPWGDFAIGSGFDVDTRIDIWNRQADYLGRTVTFKFQRHGTLDKPRIPIFKGFRPEME